MSVEPPEEGEESLKTISKSKNIGEVSFRNKGVSNDPKVLLSHIRDLDCKQEGRKYKIAQFNTVNNELNKEVALQKKSGKKIPSICIYVPQVDFNDIPMFTRMAFKKYDSPVVIFTNDLTVSIYTSLIGYYIDKNSILESALSFASKEKGNLYSEDDDASVYCVRDISLESFNSIRQSLRLKDSGVGAAEELEDFLNSVGI